MAGRQPFILGASGRADKMPDVAIVFLTDVLHQFVSRQQAVRRQYRKWILIGSGVVNGHFLSD
jgi:hypothetical protein